MNLMNPNFAKLDEFVGIKRTSKVKLEVKRKIQEIKEKKKLAKRLKKIEKHKEKTT